MYVYRLWCMQGFEVVYLCYEVTVSVDLAAHMYECMYNIDKQYSDLL